MNTKIITSIVLGLVLASTASAVTPTLYQNRQEADEVREEAQERAEERREEMQGASTSPSLIREREQERNENASGTKAQVREMVKNKKDIILKDFVRGIEVLENLYSRIESRIEKMAERGFDMTEAKALLKVAADKIVVVKAEFEKLSAMIPEEVEKAKASDLFKLIREQSVVVRKAMRETHSSMVDIINSLKKSVTVNATSTIQ